MSEKEINALEEIQRAGNGGRGRSTLDNEKAPMNPAAKGFLVIAAVVGIPLLVLWTILSMRASDEAAAETPPAGSESSSRVSGAAHFRPARTRQPETPATGESPPVDQPAQGSAQYAPGNQPATTYTQPGWNRTDSGSQGAPEAEPVKTPAQLLHERRLGGGLNENESTTTTQSPQQPPASPADGGSSGSGPLAEQMQPVRMQASAAGLFTNRDLLLTQGAMLDCQLETRLVTTQAGQVLCYLTRNIYSASGRVVLLDQGTKVVGQYQGGMTQGQARIFVLWTRAETPRGVFINLDSAGAGPLGEAGLGGWVDTHFWKRYGAALMISTIDDFADYLSNQGSNSNEDRITFDNTSDTTQDMATTALENTINIPPTLYKNHGERVQIFVARDLDFSGVYSLERK